MAPRVPCVYSRLISLLWYMMAIPRSTSLRLAVASTTARSAFVGSLQQRFHDTRTLLTRARPAAATATTTMAWTSPGGSNKKRQHNGPSAEELERRVRQKVTEVATAVDSFLGGGDAHAQAEALAMHTRYRQEGEVASRSSPSPPPPSSVASSSLYNSASSSSS
eukprot:CAMPEP_0205923602 /NCGR_PEP_ID=MMETSP1325-20131115/16498_1 /ASSEMBLY_ACC=CAM_ASM_000708 /TAXON_ID=236786 /ORGANISM="Florenciella sp., Strain RCC1007" /LENGTH=163 /DNA_ID=CAMNT_0053291845 /DNA_START=15 /DNA_END=503 /DNA_ORIENTATION=-